MTHKSEINMFNKFALLFFLICSSAFGYQQELLKPTDIKSIMKQILNQHLGDKMMTKNVLQNAIKAYIKQFDTDHIYLLKSEVLPFLQLSPEELDQFLKNYEQDDFLLFTKLNQIVRKSILRSRALRQKIETTVAENFFKNAINQRAFHHYAKSEIELQQRLKSHLEDYIFTQKRRYGDVLSPQRKDSILRSYEESLKNSENSYLYQNDEGQTLSKIEQENLATLHILKALASSLDSHTSFYEKNEAYDIRMHLQKEFQGIGLGFQEKDEGIVVTNLLEGGPAAKSQLIEIGDILLTIDSVPVKGLTFEKVINKLHNEEKSSFKLEFKREASADKPTKTYSITLQRQAIVLKNDRVDILEEKFGNGIIGIIKLHSF